jgi:DNA (cytosine-5)-methyltransferase 1
MEAASVAWETLGFRAVGFAEIDPFASAVLRHRYPGVPNYGSLTEYAKWPISVGDVDILVGGTPCQSYSVAGKRLGLDDPRGQLMLSFLGLADRIKPRYILWENVPGVLSSGNPRGSDFAQFLAGLGDIGYGFAYRVLDSQSVGECRLHTHRRGWSAVPQRRRRVFVLASRDSGGWRDCAEILSIVKGSSRYLEKKSASRKDSAPDAGESSQADLLWLGSDQPNAARMIDKAGTLVSHQSQRGGIICPTSEKDVSPFTASSFGNYAPVTEGAGTLRAQRQGDETLLAGPVIPINTENMSPSSTSFGNTVGKPGDPQFSITASHCHGVAHPIAFRKAKRAQTDQDDETWVDDDKTNTLNNFDIGDTRATVAVVEPKLYEHNGSDARVKGPLDVAPTVIARYGTGGNNMPLVQGGSEQTPNVDVSGTLRANPGSGFRSDGSPVEPVVIVSNNPVYDMKQHHNPQPTENVQLTTKNCATIRGDTPLTQDPTMAVRRLTPTECMRLQGFPDDHARIPWKNKPASECPDGPQYKCAGNSFSVNVVRWIGTQIVKKEASRG